jgi:DnaK suppressor protein
MDTEKARALLSAERTRVEGLLQQTRRDAEDDREQANAGGDMSDPAESLTAEQGEDAVVAGLEERLAAIARADKRIDAGTYGHSIRSGERIPDERLQADPAAELTVDEAAGS